MTTMSSISEKTLSIEQRHFCERVIKMNKGDDNLSPLINFMYDLCKAGFMNLHCALRAELLTAEALDALAAVNLRDL